MLTDLRDALYGFEQRDPIHITVRGPYKEAPSHHALEDVVDALKGNFVMLADVGLFETRKGFAVYLNAYSRIFDEIWWKPDFSKKKRIPHLTLFETDDRRAAYAVRDFLISEQIVVVTHALDLTVYTSKQSVLLQDDHALLIDEKGYALDRIEVKEGLISRAKSMYVHIHEPMRSPGVQLALM